MTRNTPTERVPLLWAETALCWLTLVVIVSMRRLFDGWDYLPVLGPTAVVAHVTAALSRRQGWTMRAAAPLSAAIAILTASVMVYPDTLVLVVPGFDTWQVMATDLADAWRAFGVVEAPTPASRGFLVGASVLVWTVALASDTAAFRLRTMTEALVAPLALFVFVAAFGVEGYRLEASAGLVASAWVFLLLARTSSPVTPSVPLASTRNRLGRARMNLGFRLASGAVVLGVVCGPLLPGAGQPGAVQWKDPNGGSGPRVTLSPLVDARGRLIEQSTTELFRVTADRPAYWRISGLDRFNGTVWGSNRSYSSSGGRLRDVPDDAPTLEQRFTISGLSSIWIPAAYEPVRFRGDDIIWDEITGTLVIRRGQNVAPGTTYTVVSSLEIPTPDELRSASAEVPVDVAADYTDLPADFSPDVRLLAEQLTAGAATPFDRAIALQDFFRTNFVYALDAVSGHDTARMERFLFEDRRGYCEQFAGSFAAMARSIGIPARVAVGFTPGERVGNEFIVRGEHYHAWPEVWIDGRWVMFEPTPGRGAPGAEIYTGVAPQQAVSGDPAGLEGGATGSGAGPDTGQTVEGPTTDNPGFVDDLTLTDQGQPQRFAPWVIWAATVIAAGLAACLAWVLVFPGIVSLRRRRRRARAGHDAKALAMTAWTELCSRMSVAGLAHEHHETHRQFAQRIATSARLPSTHLEAIAEVADRARFDERGPSIDEAQSMLRLVDDIDTELTSGLRWSERLRQRSDPRRLVSTN